MLLVVALVPACGRETIGLGRNPPDAAPAATMKKDTPTSVPDAATPKTAPSTSASASAAPSASHPPTQYPPPPRFPTRPAEHDAGTRLPVTGDPPAIDADAGHDCRVSPGECGVNTPYCELTTGKCVACAYDFQCSFGQHCDLTTHECLCSSDMECRTTGRCDPLTHLCLPLCSSSGVCGPQGVLVCDTSRQVCVECLANAECSGKTYGGIPTGTCHHGLCVQCWEDAECTSPKAPHCQLRGGICVECLRTADCAEKEQCFSGYCVPTGNPLPSSSSSPP